MSAGSGVMIIAALLGLLVAACTPNVGQESSTYAAAPACGWISDDLGIHLQTGVTTGAVLHFSADTVAAAAADLAHTAKRLRFDGCDAGLCTYTGTEGTLYVRIESVSQAVPSRLRVAADGTLYEQERNNAVSVLRFAWLSATDSVLSGWRIDSLVLDKPYPNASFLHHGFQAGTFSGWERIGTEPMRLDLPYWADDGENRFEKSRPGTSWWQTAVALPDRTLVLGAASALTWSTQLWLNQTAGLVQVAIRSGIYGEEIGLQQADHFSADSWYAFCEATPALAMDRLGMVAATYTPRRPWPYRNLGWSSWYNYYNSFYGIDLNLNLQNIGPLKKISDDLVGAPPLVQVDDAWAANWGDWWPSPEDGFPDTLTGLAGAIVAAGGRAGLWLAPLHADTTVAKINAHPDWWLHDRESGEKLVLSLPGLPDRFVLDLSNTEVLSYLEDLFETLGRAGFSYLKIDFLHDALRAARRSDSSQTPIQLYRAFLTRIRIAAERGLGEPVYLLASLAPIMPSAGLVNAIRIGPDISYEIGRDPLWGWTLTEYRSLASRAWLHYVFDPDPDNLIVRGYDTDQEGMSFWGNVAAGGALITGDPLLDGKSTIDSWQEPERARAIKNTRGAEVEDLAEAVYPWPVTIPSVQIGTTDVPGCWTLVGSDYRVAFGWRKDRQTRCSLPFQEPVMVEGDGILEGRFIEVPEGGYAVVREADTKP